MRPIFLTSSRAPGCAAAAASQKAALEMSPGTVKLRDSGICPPLIADAVRFALGPLARLGLLEVDEEIPQQPFGVVAALARLGHARHAREA